MSGHVPASQASGTVHGSGGLSASLRGPGRIEVVRLIKEVPPPRGFARGKDELIYLAKAANGQAVVNWVHFVATDEEAALLHPELDMNAGRIRVFHPQAEFEQVRRTLREFRERYCYIWRSPDLLKARAWLFTPR